MMRRGRPGLIGLAARTAVVAGTATAVNNSMTDRRQQKAQNEWEQQQYQAAQQQAQMDAAAQNALAQAQAAAPQPVYQQPPAPAAPAGGTDLVGELHKLASLRDSGMLSEAEFAAAKGRLLA